MFRSTLSKSSLALTSKRVLGNAQLVRFYADAPAGSIGASGDAFSKREKASEDKYMKDQERQKAEKLRKHIKDSRAALDDLEKSIGH